MQLHQFIEKSREVFLQQVDRARVVLLHPRSRYRSVLVAQLINAPNIPTFYYAMGPDDVNLQAFIAGLTHDLASQHPLFGRHINTLPDSLYEDYAANADLLLTTFARDLAEINADRYLFILDEYDRSDSADDIQDFIERLTDVMPDHCRLVINSRTLPRLPWISMIARGKAAFIEDDQVIHGNFYDLSTGGEDPAVEIYALGPSFVRKENTYVDAWEGHLPRLLLFFALDRPVVTRSDICHAFWPELNADQAVNVFHVTKRRLHKALNLDVLVHEDGYYRINPDLPLYYDVLDFVQTLVQGRAQTDTGQVDAWQKAIELYRGPFLQGHDDAWIQRRRQDYQAGYIEALMHLAGYWETIRDRPEQSLALCQKALSATPQDERLHREVMRLYAKLGRRSEAAAHFQNLRHELSRDKREPSPETHQLFQTIMG
jgi:DNA-binding SARP family transcriptional activator